MPFYDLNKISSWSNPNTVHHISFLLALFLEDVSCKTLSIFGTTYLLFQGSSSVSSVNMLKQTCESFRIIFSNVVIFSLSLIWNGSVIAALIDASRKLGLFVINFLPVSLTLSRKKYEIGFYLHLYYH